MNNQQFDLVRSDMHRRFGRMFSPEIIDRVVDEAIETCQARARIATFLTVMVEREATEKFEDLMAQGGALGRRRQEILYVCHRNAGRSQLASAFTRELVGDQVLVRSVGLEPAEGIDPTVLQVLRERGMDTSELYQKTIVPRTVHTSDVVVLMGVDEVPGIPGRRYEHWDIDDPEGEPVARVRVIADEVAERVRSLLGELGLLRAAA